MQYKCLSDYVKSFKLNKLKQILNNGELYMFDAKLTKEQHDKIVKDLENIINEKPEKELAKESDNESENTANDIEKLINLKNFSN